MTHDENDFSEIDRYFYITLSCILRPTSSLGL